MAKSKWAYRLYRFKNFLKGRESYYVHDYRGNIVTRGNEGNGLDFHSRPSFTRCYRIFLRCRKGYLDLTGPLLRNSV